MDDLLDGGFLGQDDQTGFFGDVRERGDADDGNGEFAGLEFVEEAEAGEAGHVDVGEEDVGAALRMQTVDESVFGVGERPDHLERGVEAFE